MPDTTAGERWRNALRLLALYGLRPEELKHLQARERADGSLGLWCSYRKTCGGSKTDPRWLEPCPLRDGFDEPVQWNLPQLMAAGLLPLPALGDKYALQTFLNRLPLWQAMKERCATVNGEWLRPYVFRDSYSLRCHRRGIETGAIASAMGHSLAVHSSSYRWADETQTAQAFAVLS